MKKRLFRGKECQNRPSERENQGGKYKFCPSEGTHTVECTEKTPLQKGEALGVYVGPKDGMDFKNEVGNEVKERVGPRLSF